ncbi:serine protease [Streptomyces broussonetiae]|uniref:Serine protease n=1 Tax=Streptomyces broussonetiae TaxID=2686304 RepID=A0A6I6NAA8_9ACTN|nr:SSI family serine proteinase inhibitor [Streptomyces broussonetiae]QHA07471.1 serine protease [Streptomyces broussonetiae]
MTYLTRAAVAAGALLAATGLLAAGPAHAAPHDQDSGNWLRLTVTRGETPSGDVRGTTLLCDPPRGHARAAEACAELTTADGDIGRIPARRVFCPALYAPVNARARGRWNGRPVDFRQTYTNTCVMNARTGAVFALDA